jgi:hypothetical protein
MTAIDLRGWTPSVARTSAIDTGEYAGLHRAAGRRREMKARFSIARMHYTPRHLHKPVATAV